MCFSANASFIAGAALTVAGVVSVSQVRKPAHLIFACMPLFFAIQQICEGFVWTSLTNPDFASWHEPSKYAFLVFAQVIWPFFIPLSILSIEPSPKKRKIILYFLFIGIACSLILCYRLFFLQASAQIDGCHIAYKIGWSKIMLAITGTLYLTAIVISPFFSSWKNAVILAAVNVLSLVTTEVFYEAYLVSVWCFFAAAQSVLVVLVMRDIKKRINHVKELESEQEKLQ